VKASTCLVERPAMSLALPVGTRWLSALGNLYCRMFHKALSIPVNGRYHCWQCLREFDVEW
jgi:hypothetical protein